MAAQNHNILRLKQMANHVQVIKKAVRALTNIFRGVWVDWIVVCALMIMLEGLTDENRGWQCLFVHGSFCVLFAVGFLIITEMWQFYWWLFVEAAWWLSNAAAMQDEPLNLTLIFGFGYAFWSWRRLVFVYNHLLKNVINQVSKNLAAKDNAFIGRSFMLNEVIDKSDLLNFDLLQINAGNAELINVISHDLRAPQVTIICLVDLLKRTQLETEAEALLDELKDNAVQTLKMADEVLEFSHVNGVELKLTDINIVEVVYAALKVIKPQARMKSMMIKLANHADPEIWMMGNQKLLEHAVLNFLTNAVRYGAKNTEIKIEISTKVNQKGCDWVDLSIRDHGKGMSSELVTQLLTGGKLKRGKSGPESDAAGSKGMGFRIAQTVIKRHCGYLDVKSTEGVGTEILMSFPMS